MQTKEELYKEMSNIDVKLRNAETAIVSYAKTLVPVLLDAGRTSSAKELERLLFERDVVSQECGEFLKANLYELLGVPRAER